MKNYIIHPITRETIRIKSNYLLDIRDKIIGSYDPGFNRYDWLSYIEYPDNLTEQLKSEIKKFDAYAKNSIDSSSKAKNHFLEEAYVNLNQDPIYQKNPGFSNLEIDLNSIFRNAHILDIGGTCRDAWKMIQAGCSSVTQVDPSSECQKVGYYRVAYNTNFQDISQVITFHTAVAEYLPFADCVFDVVFSRASIHHTNRTKALPEIRRVLSNDGLMLLIEPVQATLINKLMHFSRKVRAIDRGTDNPLTPFDLELIKSLFKSVDYYPKNIPYNSIKVAIKWLYGVYGSKQNSPIIIAKA